MVDTSVFYLCTKKPANVVNLTLNPCFNSKTKQPPAEAGGFGLRTGSPDTRRLNDASMVAPSGIHHSRLAQSDAPSTA